MHMRTIKLFAALLVSITLFSQSSFASPWAETNKGYGDRTMGKLGYGLRNSVFGWMQMFKEAKAPKYDTEWEGFCVGIGRSVIYTASGLVQLATFPIPVDFPDVGPGV